MGVRVFWILLIFLVHLTAGQQYDERPQLPKAQKRLGEFPPGSGISIFGLGSAASKILHFLGGGIMYLNLVLGNQNGFSNLTTQIQNLTSDVDLYREEIINKIEDTEHLINHSLIILPNPFLNHSDDIHHDLDDNSEDILNEVLQSNVDNGVDSDNIDNFLDNAVPDDQDRDDNDSDEIVNEIDVILNTVMARMRRLEENNEMVHNSVDKIVKSVLNERENSRVKRQTDSNQEIDREPKQSKEIAREKLETVVETALRQRTHNDAQTVGTMLAQIPGILEDHGLSYDSIVSGFRSFESSIVSIAKQMHEDSKQMHEDNVKLQTKLTSGLDDSLKMQNKLAAGIDGMTSGLDGIKEELHDQLEPIALKIGDESKLDEIIHEGFHQIAEKLGDESNLDDIVHDGLHQIAEKLGDENKLEETIHHGFETIAENMGGKSNLEDAVHDGLHGIADKLDQITTYGLDGIMDSLDKNRNPILNLPSTFGTTLGQAVGQSVGNNVFGELNDQLRGIIDSIGDHGDLLAGTITNQNIIDEGEEANVLQTYDQIVTALQGMTSAISTGNSDITNAVSSGLDNTKKAIETSGENSKVSLDVLNAAMVSSLNGGYQQLSDALGNGHTKLADSIHDSNDALETIATNIAKAGTENKEALSSVGSKIESGNTKISTSIDTAADFIDHVKEEIKTSGEMMETGLGNIEDKLSMLETLGVNVKNLDTHLMDSLKTLATSIQNQGENLINSLSDMKDELQTVGGNIQNGKESLDKVGETLKNLEAISSFMESNVANLKSLDDNTALGLKEISDTLVDASMKNKEGFEAVAALLLGTTDEGPLNIVDSLLTLATNVKDSGMENKDELAKIVENIATVGSGIETVAMKTEESGDKNMNSLENLVSGLGSLSTLVDTASGYLKDNGEGSDDSMAAIKMVLETINAEMLASNNRLVAGLKEGHDKIADNIEDGSDNMADKISNSILTGNDKISDSIDAGNDNVADSITAGQNKVAESITAGHTKVSDSITAGQTKVSDSITAGQTKVADSIETGQNLVASSITAGQTKVADSIETGQNLVATSITAGNTKISDSVLAGLNDVASNVKDAGTSNKDALTDVSLKIQENADNIKQAGVDNKMSLEDISSKISTSGTDNKDSLDALASAVTTGDASVAEALNVKVTDALTSISDNVKENADNVKVAGQDNKSGLDDLAAAVTTGQDKVTDALTSVSNNVKENADNVKLAGEENKSGLDDVAAAVTTGQDKVSNALTTGDNKIEAVLLDSKTSLDNIKNSVDVQNERILNGLNSLATNVKDAGDSNKDALADVSLNIKENADNVKQAGVDNKESLNSLGTHTETVATNIDKLATNVATAGTDNKDSLDGLAGKVEIAATNIQQAGADNKNSLDSVATAMTTGDDKIEAVLQDAKTSLDNIKGAVDVQNERILNGLTSVATNVKEAGDSNQVELSKLGGHTETAATNLGTLATNVKDAGASNKASIDIMAANVKQAGVDNLAGLTTLGGHTETAATNLATLATNVAKAGTDNKESLDDISAKINTAAGHLEKSATNSDTFVGTFSQFAADSKTNLENIKGSLDTLAGNNKDGLALIEAAIKAFTTSATTDTTNIISAVSMLENSLGDSADEIETELDEIRQAIITAQGRTAQLAAIKRLADKIECTDDCFVSEVQAEAILEGLNRNDVNLNSLTGDLNALALDPIATAENENERNEPSILSIDKRSFASQEDEEFDLDLADLIVALQNPEFNITKKMREKGHDFNELKNLLGSEGVENEGKIIKFLNDANITIPNTENVTENLKRNGKALINFGNSASSILEIEKILKRAENSSDIKVELNDLVENFSKLEKYQGNLKGIQRASWSNTDIIKFLSNFLMNPVTAVAISRAVEQVVARVYNNKYETTWQDLEPEGYLDSGYGKFPLEPPARYRKLTNASGNKILRTISCDGTKAKENEDCTDKKYPYCVTEATNTKGVCKTVKYCSEDSQCESVHTEYACYGGLCGKNYINSYITRQNGAVLIGERKKAVDDTIQALKAGAGSVYGFKADQRSAWVSEKWSKHSHVQWIIGMSQQLTKDTIDFLKDQFNIQTWSSLIDSNEAQDRYRNIIRELGSKERKDMEKLLDEMDAWYTQANNAKNYVTFKLGNKGREAYNKYLDIAQKNRDKLKAELQQKEQEQTTKFETEVTPECPVALSKLGDITDNLVKVSFSGLSEIRKINTDCDTKLNEYFTAMRDAYKDKEFKTDAVTDPSFIPAGNQRDVFTDIKELVKKIPDNYPVKSSSRRNPNFRQASTTDDNWTYNDNIFDIMIRNNEDLITALVGKFPADENTNLLSGMEKSTEDIKTALTNIETALKGFTRKLTSKFTAIKTYADSHTHVCTPMACANTATGLPPLVYPPSARNILNATQEEYNKTVAWVNQLFVNETLDASETAMKDYVLSQPIVLAEILQPFLDDLKKEIIAKNETQIIDAKQANSPSVDVHLFSLDEGEDLDNGHEHHHHGNDHQHDHLHEHVHNEEEHDADNNEIVQEVADIIDEERKLSRKFSGIADILERKMEAVEKQSRIDLEEEGAFLFSGLEKMKKSRKTDGSKHEEKAFMFNLF